MFDVIRITFKVSFQLTYKRTVRLMRTKGAVTKRMGLSLLAVCLTLGFSDAAEPLKIFVLAGQSNMVGHARAHTIATLFASENPRDRELLDMILREDHGLSGEDLEQQLNHARELDALTGGISNDKIKKMEEGDAKTSLVAKTDAMKARHEEYKKKIAESLKVSSSVYIHSIADRNQQSGPLKIGCGASIDKIGPEYGFGMSLAQRYSGPILIIKTSWGGKSLNYNFRPPSSGAYQLTEKELAGDKVEQIKENVSLNYQLMVKEIREVLSDLGKYHPEYDKDAGHEFAGFVWFQGFNDQFAPEYRDAYRQNMIHLIGDVRKELGVAELPFVIGVLGTAVTPEKIAENPVSVAQRAAAEELGVKGKVAAVESYLHYSHYSNEIFQKGWPEHYHEWDTVGSDRPYHYLGSGAFFVRLGDAFADAVVELSGGL